MSSSARLYAGMALCGTLFLAACQGEAPQMQAAPPPTVTVSQPLVRNIADWDEFVGRFEAIEQVDLKPRISGYLVEVGFRDGSFVNRGDLLFRIDPRPFEARVNEAQSRLRSAETRLGNANTELDRARGLLELQAVSQEEFDTLDAAVLVAESEVAAARASLRSAELDLEYTRITAPVSGRVSSRRVDVGNTVKADDTLLTTIVSIDPIHFVFQSSEAVYLRYRRANPEGLEGAPVRIRLQDETEAGWEGELEFFDNAISGGSGTIQGRALIPNPDGFLLPGMFGNLQLQATRPYDGILLPDSAIGTRGAQRLVFIVNSDNVVEARPVELGQLVDGLRVIRSGLQGNETVVINGIQRAIPGGTVQPVSGSIED